MHMCSLVMSLCYVTYSLYTSLTGALYTTFDCSIRVTIIRMTSIRILVYCFASDEHAIPLLHDYLVFSKKVVHKGVLYKLHSYTL